MVMNTIKILLKYIRYLDNQKNIEYIVNKFSKSLLKLLRHTSKYHEYALLCAILKLLNTENI